MTAILRDRHVVTCPECEGGGEVTVNDTNPYGYGPDPQCDEFFPCENCGGSGEVETWVDPLIAMKRAKWNCAKWNRANGWYEIFRMRAMRRCSGLAQADVLALATRCVTATNHLKTLTVQNAEYRQE